MTPDPTAVRPPRLARAVLELLLPSTYRDHELGDLEEGLRQRAERDGVLAARRWYWHQVLRSAGPNLIIRLRNLRRRPRSNLSMETFLQDVRYGVRAIRKSPAFAVVSTITLALAIGVNSAIFSLVNAIVFADLPMENAATVIIPRITNSARGLEDAPFTYLEYLEYRDESESIAQLAAWRDGAWVLTGGDEPQRIDGYRVTANFLEAWRVPTVLGRGFVAGEAQPGAPRIAILSHGFWSRHFGGRADAVGSTIRLDGEPYAVVGVLSPKMEFANLAEAEVWVPLYMDRADEAADQRIMFVTGRMARSATSESTHREWVAIGERLAERYPVTNQGWSPVVETAQESLLDDEDETILLLLALTVAFVLLIACANVANMLLARGTVRSREMAVRSALGAGRIRLVRQLMTESFVIGVVAAVAGLGLSRALMQTLIMITNGQQLVFEMAGVDGNVLAFTLIISLLAPVAFGLLPALKSSREDVSHALKEGGARSGGGRAGARTRGLLVGTQVSLALMLMVVAGLLTRTVIELRRRALGFEPAGVLTMNVVLPDAKYQDDEAIRRFFASAMDRVRGLPTVEDVALASLRPVVNSGGNRAFEVQGRPPLEPEERPTANVTIATHRFLNLIGIPILRGRGFRPGDASGAVPVALVSREAAETHWPDEDPIGQRIRFTRADGEGEWTRIVGVTGDIRADGDSERPERVMYLPFAQATRRGMVMMVRTSTDPSTLGPAVRTQIWQVDPDQPVDNVGTMEQALYDEQSTGYALIALFLSFALFALCMAAVGIYGVMSYAVSQRSGEFSIRMALGAKARDVRRMVLLQGGKLIVFGGLAGLGGALLLSRLLSSVVFGISALDPVTFVGVPLVLGGVGLAANLVPALRATRIEPMRALRIE